MQKVYLDLYILTPGSYLPKWKTWNSIGLTDGYIRGILLIVPFDFTIYELKINLCYAYIVQSKIRGKILLWFTITEFKKVSYTVLSEKLFKKSPTFHYENDLLRHCPHGVCEGTCIGPAVGSLEVPNLHRLLVQRDRNPLGIDQRDTIFGPHHIWFWGALGVTEEVDSGPEKLMELGWRARYYIGFCCE